MNGILIQGEPDFLLRIPATDPAKELTDMARGLTRQERPMDSPALHIVEDKQIEPSPDLLPAVEHQAAGRGVTSSPIGFDRDRLVIVKEKDPVAREMPPDPANPGQNRRSLRIPAAELLLNAAEFQPLFFRMRRRCSRLMALRIPCLMR
jgi:hypothetical protein